MLIVILWALLSGRSKHAPVIKEPLRSLSECLDTEIEKGRVKLDLLTKPKTSTSDKLSIACDPTVEGCIKLNRWEAGPVNFLRISVKTDSVEPITNCKAFLTRIEKNEEKKWGDHSPQLTFSEGEDPDALAKTVYNKVPAFIDVLALTSWGEIRPGTKNRIWPFMPRMHEIFSEVGDYVLTVVITGDGAEPITALLKFNWTRNWQTSWLTLIPESSIQSPEPPQTWAISYEQETEMLEILKDSPKAAVMIMSTKEDRVGNCYAMRLVQVLRKTGNAYLTSHGGCQPESIFGRVISPTTGKSVNFGSQLKLRIWNVATHLESHQPSAVQLDMRLTLWLRAVGRERVTRLS